MNTRILTALATAGLTFAASHAQIRVWSDAVGDAQLRRTDPGNDGAIGQGAVLPDLTGLTISAWKAWDPANDPYSGTPTNPSTAHLVRIDLFFAGLINPPGALGGNQGYDPFRFGPSPVYGFIELDLDGDQDTGGELDEAATQRYLGSIARFGRLPLNGLASRAARRRSDWNNGYSAPPQFERSGQDFSLVLCGCFDVTLVQEFGNGNGIFEANEVMIVRSRFFQRAGGYECLSGMFGGSAFGRYDPWVNLRFAHSSANNQTTVTLVYALDMIGAGQLAGEPPEQRDFNVGNQTSIEEAIAEVIDEANRGLFGACKDIASRWAGRNYRDAININNWTAMAIVGTAYQTQDESDYVWTDTGFGAVWGDVNADGMLDRRDGEVIQAEIAARDGGPTDADGIVNGKVTIADFAFNFDLFDVNYDGVIDKYDVAFYCTADFNADGVLDVRDFLAFQTAFAQKDPRADLNSDGKYDVRDYFIFLRQFSVGC